MVLPDLLPVSDRLGLFFAHPEYLLLTRQMPPAYFARVLLLFCQGPWRTSSGCCRTARLCMFDRIGTFNGACGYFFRVSSLGSLRKIGEYSINEHAIAQPLKRVWALMCPLLFSLFFSATVSS